MKIRYDFVYPFSMPLGGGGQVIEYIIQKLAKFHDIKLHDKLSSSLDFDIFIQFGNTYISLELLEFFKKNHIKIILIPIFDRIRPLWFFKFLNFLNKFPIQNIFSYRYKLFQIADIIITHNKSESRDLKEIYNADTSKIELFHYGISDDFFDQASQIDKDSFKLKFGFDGYVFCPAASINKRKNQIRLIKALKNTGIKLVLNNTQNILDGIGDEFKLLTTNDPDILCLKELTRRELIECYKGAKVVVSVSQAETAGLTNLEAAYLGCNLVVSDIEAFHEYLEDFPISYVNQNNTNEIKDAIMKALKADYNTAVKDFVENNYRWDSYINKLDLVIEKINYKATSIKPDSI
jgi:glycosyltransferase involved in cell wall biosynthesis